jgi:hypothetical protein
MRNLATTPAAALFLMAGCGDFGIDQNPGPGTDTGGQAATLFQSLHGQLMAECGSCHTDGIENELSGPDWLATEAVAAYDKVRSYQSVTDGPIVGNSPGNSKLYFYGEHTGPAMSPALSTLVENWIVAQAAEDGTTPPPDPGTIPGEEPKTLVEALTMFADCMAYLDFEASEFSEVANQSTAEGLCRNCHNTGLSGAFLNDSDEMFLKTQQMPFVLKFATGVVNPDGSFADLVPAYRFRDKRGDQGHPNYILAGERLEALNSYFDLTYVRYRSAIDSGTPCVREGLPMEPLPPQ